MERRTLVLLYIDTVERNLAFVARLFAELYPREPHPDDDIF